MELIAIHDQIVTEVVLEVGNADILEHEGDNCDQSNMSHLCDRHHLCDSKNHYRT